jgi:GTPase
LSLLTSQSPISFFFSRFSEELIKRVRLSGKLTKSEDRVIEYKPQDIFGGTNESIIDALSEDIRRKLERSPYKLYIIGVDDDGTLNPISSSKLKSDRIEFIRGKLQEKLDVSQLYIFPIIDDNKGILLLLVFP